MDAVENSIKSHLVRIGFGKKQHGAALLTAGAEKVFFHPGEKDILISRGALREGDVLLVSQPTILTVKEYQRAKSGCFEKLLFQVVGGEPVDLVTDEDFRDFRKKKAHSPELAITQSTGRPKGIKYTVEQADAIIRLWHEKPKRMPAEITALADKILGLEDGTVKKPWVRDLVKKYVGTAQRDKPAGWRGVRID